MKFRIEVNVVAFGMDEKWESFFPELIFCSEKAIKKFMSKTIKSDGYYYKSLEEVTRASMKSRKGPIFRIKQL